MSLPDAETDALAGEYVLGLLGAEETREVERRLRIDEALQRAVADWRERLSELDLVADRLPPSPQLWERIESAIGMPRVDRAESSASLFGRLWESLGFWRGMGLAGTAASLGLAVGLGLVAGRPEPQPVVVAIMQGADVPTNVIVEAFGDGSIRLVPLGTMQVPAGRTLQVWTLWDRARGPVSMGTTDGLTTGRFSADGLPVPQPEQLYEISLEPEGGSPTGRPTGPILFKGTAVTPS
jgi:anti-sigma-K factor RskA